MITSYKELSIKKYQEIREILAEDGGELTVQARIIACLNDWDEDTVLNLSLTKYNELAQGTAFLMEKPKLDGKIPNKLNIKGQEYIITTDVRKLTTGQYIDYQTLCAQKDQEKYLANILACFIVPKGCTYGTGYDVDEITAWISENLSIQDAMNICFFFRKKYLNSIRYMATYLGLQMKILKKRAKTVEAREMMEKLDQRLKALQKILQDAGDGLAW